MVLGAAVDAGKLDFWPKGGAREWLAFAASWTTLAIGSIPQQDVFQRVSAAKDEKTAGRGSVIGGCVYFIFAFIPMYLAYSATLIDPAMVNNHINADSQYILPNLILQHTPLAAQAIFFGALLAAISLSRKSPSFGDMMIPRPGPPPGRLGSGNTSRRSAVMPCRSVRYATL